MQWKRLSVTVFATAMICTLACFMAAPARAQAAGCNQVGSTLVGASLDGKWTYFSSWNPQPQFFVVKMSNGRPSGKSTQLINQGHSNPRNRVIIPAPCGDVYWSPDHLNMVFLNTNTDYTLGVWMYTLDSKGNSLVSARWISYGTFSKWTESGLVYFNGEGQRTTLPIATSASRRRR